MNRKPMIALCCAAIVASAGATYADGLLTFTQLKNPSTGACLDSLGKAGSAAMYACHGKGGNQAWVYDPAKNELKNPSSGLCLDSYGKDHVVMMNACHGKGGNQAWVLEPSRGEFKNTSTGQCLDSLGKKEGDLKMYDCHGKKGNQEWR
jgi:hypothetical protein